ncbi:histone deacetylase 9-B isoform X2 [Brachyhypopomus gauderio]|uniref:histone deacetylase 9-B isoform X2 n=1 Tax=Brachyhypopomus gauderio TaxID=698409 RepID=UPI004043324F
MKNKEGKRAENVRNHRALERSYSYGPVFWGRERFHLPVLCGAGETLMSHVDVKPEVPLLLDPVSPLDLRTDGRMLSLGSDPSVWERQLHQELVLIQKQQQMQKQLLIDEFQKQHESLIRQHRAQLQEHLKLQQELQAMRQQQEQLEKERKLEQQNQERELEKHRRQQQILILRSKDRARESAVASTEVKQKLQEFLLSKTTKDTAPNGSCHALTPNSKLWFTASHHTSLEQSSPPLGGALPSSNLLLPSVHDDFPLRKTASEPNLKMRSRLKQKVAERRSSPLLRRKEGPIMTPFKKRALELLEYTASSSAPGSGPSSPNGASSALGSENGLSSLPTTTRTERWPSQPKLLGPEASTSMLSLYTSPSLPNITLGLSATASPLAAGLGLKEQHGEGGGVLAIRQGLPAQLLGPVPLPLTLEPKASSSQQALLQHLLQKEQLRQQRILSTGQSVLPVHPPSPRAMKERSAGGARPKLPRHRPLNRTQSAPLPQSMLAQLVIQQQHQHFLEKQKQYQQQVHINKILSKSIEQLRQPDGHLHESEEEEGGNSSERTMQEDSSPSAGVIRKCSPSHSSRSNSASLFSEEVDIYPGVIKVKEEPADSDSETQAKESLAEKRSTYLHQVNGSLVIRAMI